MPVVLAGTAAFAVAGAGAAYAGTGVFGHHQVGTRYANGIQVSSDQQVQPIGGRLLTNNGKFMGSTVSPDGRFLAATSADKSVVLQVFDLRTYRLALHRRHRRRASTRCSPTAASGRPGRRTRRTAGPSGCRRRPA